MRLTRSSSVFKRFAQWTARNTDELAEAARKARRAGKPDTNTPEVRRSRRKKR